MRSSVTRSVRSRAYIETLFPACGSLGWHRPEHAPRRLRAGARPAPAQTLTLATGELRLTRRGIKCRPAAS